MNTKHTTEPWEVGHWQTMGSPEIHAKGKGDVNCLLAKTVNHGYISLEESHANANRTVVCVNACAGMDDPAGEINRLKEVNADLLAALERAVGFRSVGSPDWHKFDEITAQCKAAIAKAKGEDK
jgi:hypothetical protein